jgi:DNA-binding CsgD family transcriptional regulator
MSTKRADWISLIESSYALDYSDRDWLDKLFDCARPLLDPGMGSTAWTFRCTPTSFHLGDLTSRASGWVNAFNRAGHAIARKQWFDLVYRDGATVGTASERVYPHVSKDRFLRLTGGRSRDVFFVAGQSGTGLGVAFGTLLKDERKPSAMERKRWPQIAAHLGAGLRLRNVARALSFDSAPVEAVLDSSGAMHDGRNDATATPAREKLREAVRGIECARTAGGRSDPDAAMDRWEALVNGRWSLVDRFDSDGKRFVVAIRNDPAYPDPRGLTARERQVAEFVGLGRAPKEISYILGVSTSAVNACTAHAQEKLGLRSLAELAAFFAQGGLRCKLAEVAVAGEKLLLGTYPLINQHRVASLTAAEREIVVHLISGSTNSDIARRRGSSERTVANQLQSIFRKLGARSRAELAASLHAAPTP